MLYPRSYSAFTSKNKLPDEKSIEILPVTSVKSWGKKKISSSRFIAFIEARLSIGYSVLILEWTDSWSSFFVAFLL